jgi:hypothetical protein
VARSGHSGQRKEMLEELVPVIIGADVGGEGRGPAIIFK